MRTTIILLFTCALSFGVLAQRSFTNLIALPQIKLDKKTYIFKYEYKDSVENIDFTLINLKKVAIVSFTLSAPEQGEAYENMRLSDNLRTYIADTLERQSLPKLKEVFDKQGIELLSYSDFSIEQKRILENAGTSDYLDLQKEELKYTQSFNFSDWEEETVSTGTVSLDYRTWDINSRQLGISQLNSLGALSEMLGVDAVIVINNHITVGNSLLYQKAVISMVCMNPYYDKTKKPIFQVAGWNLGQVALNDMALKIAKVKKRQIVSENYTDYDTMINLLANKILEYFNFRQMEQVAQK